MSNFSMRKSVPPSDPRTLLRGRDLWWLGTEAYYDFELVVHRGREAIESGAAFHTTEDELNGELDARKYARLVPRRFACRPTVKLTAAKMAGHLRDELLPSTSNCVELGSLFQDPERLVRTGYQLIREARNLSIAESDSSRVGCCLLGLGAVMFMEDRVCDLCFRCALPSMKHCKIHSQSKRALEDDPKARSRAVQASRRARQTRSRLGWPQQFPYRLKRVLALEYVIAGMLWPLSGDRLRRWNDELEQALEKAPRVRALLPAEFWKLSHTNRLAALRRSIDPSEWITQRWPTKIAVAEQWFTAEGRTVSSGPCEPKN